ncbi:MAG TPA: hypothetical protein VFE46_14520 [Pirellulales bacterium]|jgi:hypothetical protein|nr:hypothetical protein [Pirellulales bacterium]
MSLFGSSRDDRRRRNLAEESAGESIAPPAAASSKPAARGERYTAAARRENHRHTTDFIPRHWAKLALSFVAALAAVGGLLFGYIKFGGEQNAEGATALGLAQLFDAASGSSLAGWLSSLLFGFSAAGSVLIYSIRRHKLDDYRGRYRLWLWCAIAWLVMSIDATANLHTPFALAMARATGWSMLAGSAIWWIGIWGGIVGILALRLLLEVRESRLATLGFTLVFSLWAAALATDYGWLHLGQSQQLSAPLMAIGGRLVGQVTLFFTIALYARHVLLDAEGLLSVRQRKPKREKAPKKPKASPAAEEKSATAAERLKASRIDAAHKSPSPPLAAMVQRSSASSSTGSNSASTSNYAPSKSYSTSEDDDEERDSHRSSNRRSGQNRFDDEEGDDDDGGSHGGGNGKLSKAERKRLRKQMRRQQHDEEE